MSRFTRSLVTATAAFVAASSLAVVAAPHHVGAADAANGRTSGRSIDPVLTGGSAGARCTPLDSDRLDIEISPLRGVADVILSYRDDGVAACNEVVSTQTYASAGAAVDNHLDPVLGEYVVWAADLEAAGSVRFTMPIDPCWAGIEFHRDGDTLIHSEVLGDGCEMTVDTDFVTVGHDAEIHVVQQTGNIQPPHIWSIDDDYTTVLTGLPNGTWYVKVYQGWTLGSTIEVNDGGVVAQSTVYDVADGSQVDISIWPDWAVTA